jgi:hypothetical protein
LRTLAVLCLLLVAFSGSAQAVHMHGQWLPHQQSQVGMAVDTSQLPGEAGCPLCVAMHSALPVEAAVPAAVMVADKPMRAPVAPERVPDEVWHFAGFSRPPPPQIR